MGKASPRIIGLNIELRSPDLKLVEGATRLIRDLVDKHQLTLRGPIPSRRRGRFHLPNHINPGATRDEGVRTQVHIRVMEVSGITEEAVEDIQGLQLPGGVLIYVKNLYAKRPTPATPPDAVGNKPA
jgi:ribosomal protein S10